MESDTLPLNFNDPATQDASLEHESQVTELDNFDVVSDIKQHDSVLEYSLSMMKKIALTGFFEAFLSNSRSAYGYYMHDNLTLVH